MTDAVMDQIAKGALDPVFGKYGDRMWSWNSDMRDMHDPPIAQFTFGQVAVLVRENAETFDVYRLQPGQSVLDCHLARHHHAWFSAYHEVPLSSIGMWGKEIEVRDLMRTGGDECFIPYCKICDREIWVPRPSCKLKCDHRLFTHFWIGATLRALQRARVERVRLMTFDEPFLSDEDRMAFMGECT